ncbi:MAG: hypothetical protein U9Q70_10510 [Chloroflexota bacterium]|nr:hypothetical protein [Chloroflexota bacterium]
MRYSLLILAILILGMGGGCTGLLPTSLVTLTPTATPIPTATPWPIPTHFATPEVGIDAHLWWDRWAAQHDWQLIQEAHFRWVKQRLPWVNVRPFQARAYDWSISDQIISEAASRDIKLLFRLDGAPPWAQVTAEPDATPIPPVDLVAWATFCSDVAERYRGQVAGYQIWNEPNLTREWGGQQPNPTAYVELLRVCALSIKQTDPAALVITAGLAPTGSGPPHALPDMDFLRGMYEAGAAPYFDLLGANAPGYAAPPETSPDEAAATPEYGGQRFFTFRHVEDLRAIMEEYGDAHKQIAILEFGWTTDKIHPAYSWFAVTPEEQADYLVRAIIYAREHWAPWIGTLFVWSLPDPAWTPENEEFWWSITDPFHWQSGAVRPAYHALAELEK